MLCLAYLARGQAGQGNLAGSEQHGNWRWRRRKSSRNNWICCSLLQGPTRKNVRQILWMMANSVTREEVSARQELHQAYCRSGMPTESSHDGTRFERDPNDRSAPYDPVVRLWRQDARLSEPHAWLRDSTKRIPGFGECRPLCLGPYFLQGHPETAVHLLESRADLDQLVAGRFRLLRVGSFRGRTKCRNS